MDKKKISFTRQQADNCFIFGTYQLNLVVFRQLDLARNCRKQRRRMLLELGIILLLDCLLFLSFHSDRENKK